MKQEPYKKELQLSQIIILDPEKESKTVSITIRFGLKSLGYCADNPIVFHFTIIFLLTVLVK